MKDNALYEAIGDRDVPKHRHVLKDEQIELRGPKAIEKCPYPLRRIEVEEPETGQLLVLITNHHALEASTIATIYKDRWQIEIFFSDRVGSAYGGKALKQNFKIKTFVGTSPKVDTCQG